MCWWAVLTECPVDGCGGRSIYYPRFYDRFHMPCASKHCTDDRTCNTINTPHTLPPQKTAQYIRLCMDCLATVSRKDMVAVRRFKYQCKLCLQHSKTYCEGEEHVNSVCRPHDSPLYNYMVIEIRDVHKRKESEIMSALTQTVNLRNHRQLQNLPPLDQIGLLTAADPDLQRNEASNVPVMEQQRPRSPGPMGEALSTFTATTEETPSESSKQSESRASGWTAVNALSHLQERQTFPLPSSSGLGSTNFEHDRIDRSSR